MAATVGQKHVMSVFAPGDHGSTFGGNSLAAVVGLAALIEFEREDYVGQAIQKGKFLMDGLAAIGHPAIIDIRGKGMLIGLEFAEGFDTKALAHALIEEGVLTKETRSRTFRFSPPIVATEADLAEAVERVKRAIAKVG